MTIKTICIGDTIRVEIEGRIDTMTSPELQQHILQEFQKCKNIELDFKGVEYISSAGLRVLLIGHKTATGKQGKLELINVGEQVMEVLDITGFADILCIK